METRRYPGIADAIDWAIKERGFAEYRHQGWLRRREGMGAEVAYHGCALGAALVGALDDEALAPIVGSPGSHNFLRREDMEALIAFYFPETRDAWTADRRLGASPTSPRPLFDALDSAHQHGWYTAMGLAAILRDGVDHHDNTPPAHRARAWYSGL